MVRKRIEKEKKNGIFSKINFTESYTSLILGAVVVLVIGILLFTFAKGSKIMQTSSTKEEPKVEEQKSEEKSTTSSTYTIKPGDDLWSISENIYSDGYKWLEIARANKIENPGLIIIGNKLIIPKIERKEPAAIQKESTQEPSKNMENNAINGTTYTIKEGDNLWNICVRAYGDGYRWVEIARVNNLENPDLIHSDNVLKIPRSP